MTSRHISRTGDGVSITEEALVESLKKEWNVVLEGMEDEFDAFTPKSYIELNKGVTALLLDNQLAHMNRLNESIRSAAMGPYVKQIFPVIRRAQVKSIAANICSVQPLAGPVGAIASFIPTFGDTKGGIKAGDEVNKVFNSYYTSNYVDDQPIFKGDGTTVAFATVLQWAPIAANTIVVKVAGVVTGNDTGAGTLTPVVGTPLFGGASVINYQSGGISLIFGTAPANGADVTISCRYDMEGNARIPSLKLEFRVRPIQPESRKLTITNTLEAADDMMALYGESLLDTKLELASSQLALEMDREIVQKIFQVVEPQATSTWSKNVPTGLSEDQHFRSLMTKISEMSMLIMQRTQRNGANWIITSPQIAAILQMLPHFQKIDNGYSMRGGFIKSGVLQNEFLVLVDTFMPNQILMGFQGGDIFDTGCIYSPYIPAEVPTDANGNWINPGDLTHQTTMRTRYAITVTRPEFYAKIVVTG